MELDFDDSNLLEDEAAEVGHNEVATIEGERCGICMDIIIDRGLLECCQHWFCFECIDNWSTIMNLCPLCQREFQLITCVSVYDSGESSKVDEVSLSGDEDRYIEEETEAASSPSHYIDENAVVCLDGDLCKIRNSFNYIGGDSSLDTSIACDSCDIWYHAVCVSFDLEIASEDTWVCPRCLSNEKPLEPDTSPMETKKFLEMSERTNSGCSAEAVYSGNFAVAVADEGETALVVSIVKGDECHMEPSDNNQSTVPAKMDGDLDSSHLKIQNMEKNAQQYPVKSELEQSLPHDISSRFFSDSNQPPFAAHMENKAEPVTRIVEKDLLPINDEETLATAASSKSEVADVISLKRKHSDCSGDDDNSETKPEISEILETPKLEEEETLATIHHESRSPSKNKIVDIFSIVKGTGRNPMRSSPPTDKFSEGENAAGLRVKKIKRTQADDKESLVLVEKLRKEIREAVRNKSMEDIRKNQFDPKLLAAFRAAVAGKTDDGPRKIPALAVKAKKLMLQKGKVRENLTKKIYADTNGKRKSAWHRDCEVEFWKHRCIKTRKPEKIETLKSVLSLLKKKPAESETNISSETPQASNPILSKLYLADTSVFPRNDNIKPLLSLKETDNSQNNAKSTEVEKTLLKISDAKGSSSKVAGTKLNTGNKQLDGKFNITLSNSKDIFENSDDLKKDKRKWALQVLARKKALAGNNSTEDKEGSPELKGNYQLLAQLPADMRPRLATSHHNKIPVSVRQTQLYRLTEHFLKKENLLAVRRSAATELAVADAINIEKAIADKSNSKVVYLNLCSQEVLHNSESRAVDNGVEPSSSSLAENRSECINDKNSDDSAVLQALRAAGLADSPQNSPTHSTEIPPEKGDSSLDKAREAGPDNVLDIDSIPDTDIFGDFEYELDDEDYIGAMSATKVSETQPDEDLTKVKVVFSTIQPQKSLNQFELLGVEETTPNQKETTKDKDGKSIVPMEPIPECEGGGEGEGEGEGEGKGEGGEILSRAECEELYGPGTEKLIEKPIIEGSTDNGDQAKAPDSECESNTHKEIIASNFENSCIQKKKLPKSTQKCNPSEKPSKEEKSEADGLSNSVTKKVEAYIKEHIRPLCKSGVINVEQYRWAVTKTTEKVMKYHIKAKSANFLIKEGDKIKKLAEQYVETASSGAHHKDKCK